MTKYLFWVVCFFVGYYWYPLKRFLKAFFILKKIDKNIKSIYAEQKEIADMLAEVDKEWKEGKQ